MIRIMLSIYEFLQAITGLAGLPKTDRGRFLPDSFQITIHYDPLIQRSITYACVEKSLN
jgi:hypothetical protein